MDKSGYQLPPKEICELLDATPTPLVSLAPTYDKLLLLSRPNLPGIEEIAQKELRLAGSRINPKTNGSSRSYYYHKLEQSDEKETIPIKGIPKNPRIENVSWSPNGQQIAFTLTKPKGLELWMASLENHKAKKLTGAFINDAIGGLPYRWLSDNKTIVYKSILKNRGEAPEVPLVPDGPIIKENTDKTSALRTYQDLLKNEFDEDLFEYYTMSQLCTVDMGGTSTKIGVPGIIRGMSTSPDGNYLLVIIAKRPFSYAVPYDRFPFKVEIWTRNGELIRKVADIPVADDIPKGFGAVRNGPRSFYWRNDVPATLYWTEAQDGGDPKQKAELRDQLYYWKAPFGAEPQKSIATKLRFGGLSWGNGNLAVISEWQWKDRKIVTSIFSPDNPNKGKRTLFDRSWEDKYNDPGVFETRVNHFGRHVLLTADEGQSLFLIGEGASPEGKSPFIDKLNVKSTDRHRLWESEEPYYESPIALLDPEGIRVLTKRESTKVVPNYVIHNLVTGDITALTNFPHPYKQLKDIEKQLIRYKRRDGVELTGKLYLPVGYNAHNHGSLPLLMWAYPREFKSANAAAQLTDSPHRFPIIHSHSPLYFLTQGYAVLEEFGMPIIGEGEEEPNETFVDQITMNAKAAIDKLVEMGIADPKRIAVGGHSYGAFMTANLLAHTNFFAAGIARSGAFNRTLTPFGFQSEERTFWEASKTYMEMSPFTHANKIDAPLLLIHGEADNNSGTYPMQSERFYSAIQGHGGTVRLIMLPHESHGYRAEQSIKHMLWEMVNWLNKYLKP